MPNGMQTFLALNEGIINSNSGDDSEKIQLFAISSSTYCVKNKSECEYVDMSTCRYVDVNDQCHATGAGIGTGGTK